VGHVLAHLVGNAQAFVHVIEAAELGEVAAMYPGGAEGRRADIDARATQSADALVMHVRRSIWALEGAWASCTAQGWRGRARAFVGEFPVADVPFRRWREVQVHHTDLGWGLEPEQWDPDYVRRDLVTFESMWLQRNPERGGSLPDAALALTPETRLAWLLGRVQPPGLPQGPSL
jgi:maleylpyruvate isomerase